MEPEIKKWDGAKWVVMNQQQYTETWEANWSQTYRYTGEKRWDERSEFLGQGQYVPSNFWGLQRSLAGFPSMASKLAGARIDDVKLYLRNDHWYYHAGGTAVIGYHNHSLEPSTFSHSKYKAKVQRYEARGQALWIDMPNEFGEGLRDGKYRGISLFANAESMHYYGFFYGANSSYRPKIKITYTK